MELHLVVVAAVTCLGLVSFEIEPPSARSAHEITQRRGRTFRHI